MAGFLFHVFVYKALYYSGLPLISHFIFNSELGKSLLKQTSEVFSSQLHQIDGNYSKSYERSVGNKLFGVTKMRGTSKYMPILLRTSHALQYSHRGSTHLNYSSTCIVATPKRTLCIAGDFSLDERSILIDYKFSFPTDYTQNADFRLIEQSRTFLYNFQLIERRAEHIIVRRSCRSMANSRR